MKWYNFIACFFLGVFLVNSLPHFIHGISGNRFPTPFATPPGKGLSPPIVNLLWAYVNVTICFFLFRASRITVEEKWGVIVFAAGFIIMSIRLCMVLTNKM